MKRAISLDGETAAILNDFWRENRKENKSCTLKNFCHDIAWATILDFISKHGHRRKFPF